MFGWSRVGVMCKALTLLIMSRDAVFSDKHLRSLWAVLIKYVYLWFCFNSQA